MNDVDKIRKKLGHCTLEWRPTLWLDTKNPDLNSVLGHTQNGIPYGRLMEISGWESQGKSAIMLTLAAIAQQDGALVIWGDVENSFDPGWAAQRGLAICPKCNGKAIIDGKKDLTKDCPACGGTTAPTRGLDNSRLMLIQPYVGTFNNEKKPRLSTAQELCAEMEEAMSLSGYEKKILVLDSIAALLTEGESEAGMSQTMRSRMDLPLFMGTLLRRWVGLAQVNNSLVVLVNQLRESPMAFGDPTRTPGGNAPKFYSHIRVRVRRVKGGKIMDRGTMTGILGVMKALKNKSGGIEGSEIGYKLLFHGPLEFMPAKKIKAEAAGEDDE